jgi:hypothetical protein
MKVKNTFTNPLHGIKPGEVGELPKNRESRIEQYVKYGMIEVVEEKKKVTPSNSDIKKPSEQNKVDGLTMESSKSEFGKSKVDDLKAFCEKENIEIPEDANKKIIIEAIFEEVFKGK